MRRRVRRIILAFALLVVASGIVTRIAYVNSTMPKIPQESYDEGEWVALDGAFQDVNSENTQGYSLKVEGATLCTHDEYLTKYGVTPDEPGKYGGAQCVVDVEIHVRNEGNDSGGLNMFEMVLVPTRANEYLLYDSDLWAQVQRGGGDAVSIRPGTEFVMHVPYTVNSNEAGKYADAIRDRDFNLVVARMPRRMTIAVHVSE
ncbi:MAG: DUF5028 domain-containing protein [Olsenella profusa]